MGTNVFVDAIFDAEEYQYLQASFTDCTLILLGIIASFEIRSVDCFFAFSRLFGLSLRPWLKDDKQSNGNNEDDCRSTEPRPCL